MWRLLNPSHFLLEGIGDDADADIIQDALERKGRGRIVHAEKFVSSGAEKRFIFLNPTVATLS